MCEVIDEIYEKVVHWKSNLFQGPVADWFFAFAGNSSNELIALGQQCSCQHYFVRRHPERANSKRKF